jgi:aryl-alcohol dehydrogenase
MRISAAVSRGGEPAPIIEQLELEDPRPGELRVRLVATGICHTDLHEHPGRHAPPAWSTPWAKACAGSNLAIT